MVIHDDEPAPIPDPDDVQLFGYRSDGAYLIVPVGVDELAADVPGRVLLPNGDLFPKQKSGTIFAHSPYFERYEGPQAILDDLLADARRVDCNGEPVD